MAKHENQERDNNRCIHCKSEKEYSEKFDAFYCPQCLYWLEKICPDRDCCYCKDRPKYLRRIRSDGIWKAINI